jgi:hypothetical protein
VVLTKDNHVKRNWKENKECVLTVRNQFNNLFFDCHFAKFMWRAVHFTFNIAIATTTEDLFNEWSSRMGSHLKKA